MHVVVTPQSEADIQAVADYYVSYGASPLRFLKAIADGYFWLVYPYWMVMKRTVDTLYVLTIIHGSRRLGKIIHQRLKDPHD